MKKNEKKENHESLDVLQAKKEELESIIISRRSFLGKAGRVIAVGALAHFVFIGRSHASSDLNKIGQRDVDCAVGACVNILGEEVCNQKVECKPIEEYKCGAMTGQKDDEPPPCTNDCMLPYVTDCFIGMFDSE